MRSRGSLGQGCQMSRLKPSNKSIADLFGYFESWNNNSKNKPWQKSGYF